MGIDVMDSLAKDVANILIKYPLCNRCLGRLYANLGRGLDNAERGKALKIYIVMELHKRVLEGDSSALDKLKLVIPNIKMPLQPLLNTLRINAEDKTVNEMKRCFVCNDIIDELIDSYSKRIAQLIVEKPRRSFLIGVVVPSDVLEREISIVEEYQIMHWESIKRELKREIGKRVQQMTKVNVDFSKPDVIYIVDLIHNSIRIESPSLLIFGYYLKLGRNISQNAWIRKDGSRKYPLSVEDAVRSASFTVGANDVALHIAGREDADVRVLGNGRPLVIEFKNPLKRDVSLSELENALNSFSRWIEFRITMSVGREFVSRLKQSASASFKIYRAVFLTEKSIDPGKVTELEEYFKGLVVRQRTPLRVLGRKKDSIRKRRVFLVKILQLAPNLFEALIKCEGGLYVKELINGDSGRTSPSFSEFLGVKTTCLKLDVLYVHEYI